MTTRLPIICTSCAKQMTYGYEVYGPVNEPVCYTCWLLDDDAAPDMPDTSKYKSWYGLAPHSHDLTRTGSYVGSTVFDTPKEPDETGWIHIKDELYFYPDHEVDGHMGIWEDRSQDEDD